MPKSSVLTSYGPPDVLVWKETAMPQPGAGQVRIRVRAAGVGPTDAKIRRGDLQASSRCHPTPSWASRRPAWSTRWDLP